MENRCVLFSIIKYCDLNDVRNLLSVNKLIKELCEINAAYWRNKCVENLGIDCEHIENIYYFEIYKLLEQCRQVTTARTKLSITIDRRQLTQRTIPVWMKLYRILMSYKFMMFCDILKGLEWDDQSLWIGRIPMTIVRFFSFWSNIV